MEQVFTDARRVFRFRQSDGRAFVHAWVETVLDDAFHRIIFTNHASGVDGLEAHISALCTTNATLGDRVQVAGVCGGADFAFRSAVDFAVVQLERETFSADRVADRRADWHSWTRLSVVIAADAFDLHKFALLVQRAFDFLAQIFALASLATIHVELESMFTRLALLLRAVSNPRRTVGNIASVSRSAFFVPSVVNTPASVIWTALNCLPRSVIVTLRNVFLLRRHA